MVLIKAQYGQEVKRLTADKPSYNLMLEDIGNLFNLRLGTFKLVYKDEEGDDVTFSSDEELNEAFQTVKDPNSSLRIVVVLLKPTEALSVPSNPKSNPPSQQLPSAPSGPQKPTEWKSVMCNHCQVGPILGTRYRCLLCEDFDLCSACEKLEGAHNSDHPLIQMKVPVPSKYSSIFITFQDTETQASAFIKEEILSIPDPELNLSTVENSDIPKLVSEFSEKVKAAVARLEVKYAELINEAQQIQTRAQDLHKAQQASLQAQMAEYKERAKQVNQRIQSLQTKFKEAAQNALEKFKVEEARRAKERLEKERLEKERREREEKERKEREEKERLEREKREREERERREREEKERRERERLEKERKEREEKERKEREEKERLEREKREREERERREREERERRERERLEKERKEREEKERREREERERREREERERRERERETILLQQQQLEQEKKFEDLLKQLSDMGFKNRELNLAILAKTNGDLFESIRQLLE